MYFLNPHHYPLRAESLSLFCKWEIWSSEKWSVLVKSMLTVVANNTQISGAEHSKGPFPFCVTIQFGLWGLGAGAQRLCSMRQGSKLLPLDNRHPSGTWEKGQSMESPTNGFRDQVTNIMPTHIPAAQTQLTQPHLSARRKWSLKAGQEGQGKPRYWGARHSLQH